MLLQRWAAAAWNNHCTWQSPVELFWPVELCRPRALRKPQNKNIPLKLVLYSRLVIRCTLAIMPLLVKFRLRFRGSTPTTALRDFRCGLSFVVIVPPSTSTTMLSTCRSKL